jgi:hypothetical protein
MSTEQLAILYTDMTGATKPSQSHAARSVRSRCKDGQTRSTRFR